MRFSSDFLERVQGAVPLSAIVGNHVIWDKRKSNPGKRDFWACCPFHGEKTPSFHVDDRKGFAHCFSCEWSGSHFKFLMEAAHRSFPEAVEEVARTAGMALPEQTPQSRAIAARRMTLIEANEAAARFYQQQLRANPAAMAYAAGRMLGAADLDQFRVGYAPEGSALLRANLGGGDDMMEAGLLGKDEDSGRLYDRFRGRLMFPILDDKGRAVAFSGRAMGEASPKYLNSPETAIFDKGSMFFNGAGAKALAWADKPLVVVEGHIDVIAASRTGVAAAGTMGTAMTAQHITALARMSAVATIAFDGDTAGRKAANRAIDLALPAVRGDFTVRIAALPDGQDPDSVISKRGAEPFLRLIAGAAPLAEALWQRETLGYSGTPEGRARLGAGLRAAVNLIVDADTRTAYADDMRDRLGTLGQRPKVYRSNGHSHHSTSPAASRLSSLPRVAGLPLKDAILIAAMAAAPLAALDLAEDLAMSARVSPEAARFAATLLEALAATPTQALAEVLERTGLGELVAEALGKSAAAGVALTPGSEEGAALSILQGVRRH